MSLREMLSDYWYAFQQELFPRLESELGPMGERYELFVSVLELVRVEALLPYFRGQVGRPEEDRAALARAFIAKAVFDVPTTRGLIERLEVDGRLWRLCGWSGGGRLPSEATFSRAFSEFAESRLASRLHETLIARTMAGHLVEHIRGMRRRSRLGRRRRRSRRRSRSGASGGAPQGRGAGEGAEAAGRATDDEPSADAGRPAEGLRCRQQAQRQGPYHLLGRVQAARRHGRWRGPRQLHHDLGIDA